MFMMEGCDVVEISTGTDVDALALVSQQMVCCYRISWLHRQNVVLLPTRSTVNFASGLNVNVTCSGPKPANGLRIPLMRTNGLRMIAHFSTHR